MCTEMVVAIKVERVCMYLTKLEFWYSNLLFYFNFCGISHKSGNIYKYGSMYKDGNNNGSGAGLHIYD